jgi:hypothetical protein
LWCFDGANCDTESSAFADCRVLDMKRVYSFPGAMRLACLLACVIANGAIAMAGILSFKMIESYAREALAALYAGRSKDLVECASLRYGGEPSGFVFRCRSAALEQNWFAMSPNGEAVALAPVDSGSERLAPPPGAAFPPQNDPSFVKSFRLSDTQTTEIMKFIDRHRQ